MTKEELREKIAEIIHKPWYFTPVGIANQIITFLREAGYKLEKEGMDACAKEKDNEM